MKILYAAYRHDPRELDAGSGSDYHFHKALVDSGFTVHVIGPFTYRGYLLENAYRSRIHPLFSRRRYAKFPLSTTWKLSTQLNQLVQIYQPDLVFTMFPLFLVFYQGKAPVIYRLDTTLLGWQRNYPQFSKLGMLISCWQEKRAFARTDHVITQSEWTKGILVDDYSVSPKSITVFPNPAALPLGSIPEKINVYALKKLEYPLRILLVGRDYRRKGVDIAIKTVELLNQQGLPTELVVCGSGGQDRANVRFVGPFLKRDPVQLNTYLRLYREAHLLLHPALFEAAGIVPSEAAAFATPTITNDTGGLATTVKHDESGIVLPKGSTADKYAQVIYEIINSPTRYYDLCIRTRQRYEKELNWGYASKMVARVVHKVVTETRDEK